MRAADLTRLAALAEDVVAVDGGVLSSVSFGEMADGSGRSFALVATDQAGLDQEYRISSPAPADAAPWARAFSSWTVEVRVGEAWHELELELDDDDRIAVAPEPEQWSFVEAPAAEPAAPALPFGVEGELVPVLGMAGWGVADPDGGDYLVDGCSRSSTAVAVAREVLALVARGVDDELAREVGAQIAYRLDGDVELELEARS